jgi:molybdopterin-guanine dinucleotide biosynthesis protein
VVFENRSFERDLLALARERFGAADIVLVEGGKSDARLTKVEVLRTGFSDVVHTPPGELAAVVADYAVDAPVPHFHPDNIREIADWLTAQ